MSCVVAFVSEMKREGLMTVSAECHDCKADVACLGMWAVEGKQCLHFRCAGCETHLMVRVK